MSPPIAVLIADDQPLVRAGFALVVGSQPDMEVIAEAGDGTEAVATARQHRPDVILMDIRMPIMDGIQATRAILGTTNQEVLPKIVALTTYDTDDNALQMIAAGSSGFVLKDATAADLVAAIRTVHCGDAIIAPSTTRRLLDRLAAPVLPSTVIGPDVRSLTERERTVLDHLVRGASNSEIAGALHLAEVTVKAHVGRILSKLNLRDRVHVVIWAYESTYVTLQTGSS